MTTAIALWCEGALQFQSPLFGAASCGNSGVAPPPRPVRKTLHAFLHSLATAAAFAGFSAAWLSHSKKLPNPIPHVYSPHAVLGLAALLLLVAQLSLGVAAFLWPRAAPALREGFRKTHALFGASSLMLALCAALAGLAEKAAFLVVAGKQPVRGSAVALPAAASIFLAVGVLAVVLHLLAARVNGGSGGVESVSSGGALGDDVGLDEY